MANPQAQYSPPPYNPHPPSPLHHPGPYQPPNKRPRLSPNAQSPYVSPQMTNGNLPNSGFSSPYYGPPMSGIPMKLQPDAPQTPTTGVMGPPLRPPEEKPADLNDLSDVLHSAGINLRDEEAVLSTQAYLQPNGAAYSQSSSFNSGASAGMPSGYFDQHSFNTLSPNVVGDRDSFYGAGTFNQPTVSPQVLEDRADQARRETIRRHNQIKQYELNDPFLSGRSVWRKLDAVARSQHVNLLDGPSLLGGTAFNRDTHTLGPNDGEQLARVQDQLILPPNGSVADTIALISLAAKDRLRSFLEDAAALAKGRRSSAHGVVPPELRDVVAVKGDALSAVFEASPSPNPLKRSFSDANKLPTPTSDTHPPVKPRAFPNQLAATLLQTTRAERAMEDARSEKRHRRNANGLLSKDASRTGSISGTPIPGTPGPIGETAPDAAPPKKGLTKKEQKRQADAKASEAQQHAATTSSLNLALGTKGNLFGGKKISWMTSKQPAGDSGFVPPPKANTSSRKPAAGSAPTVPLGKVFGDFREDKETGAGIQMRDMVAVLEPDLREKKALAKAYHKLSSKT